MTTMKSKKKKLKGKPKEAKTVKKTTILKRKQLRQEKRQAKKVARRDFVTKKFTGKGNEEIPSKDNVADKKKGSTVPSNRDSQQKSRSDHDKVKKDMKELKRQQKKQRKKQLLDANVAEEKNIKLLEKNLGLKRRKSKNLPKCFLDDGLDYLLDACDSSKISNLSENVLEDEAEDHDPSESEGIHNDEEDANDQGSSGVDDSDHDVDMEGSEAEEDSEDEEGQDLSDDDQEEDMEVPDEDNEAGIEKLDEEWEDIYGRKRDCDGNIVKTASASESTSKYIPPALRNKGGSLEESERKKIALEKLKKQIKGLLNRLAESNMYGISRDIEKLYNVNSRNDVNSCLAELLFSALVHETALIPARLITEHCMLVAILHANVGTEVGAFVLQQVVLKFKDEFEAAANDVDESRNAINNLLVILCYLYSWKIVQSPLMFDILNFLTERFSTKDIQLIILALTNCGMSLRRDDPVALKSFILSVQAVAAQRKADDSRVQFMLEVLTGIKNNNVNKIPNYDPSHFEQLKKSLKVCLRESKFVTELNISYRDLINAESRGRWWIVGSAFTGNLVGAQREEDNKTRQGQGKEQFSDQLLTLARRMRMNTDIRREVFCLIMSAEDYMECAEKLVKLGTKNQTEREVVFVLTDCCMQEKEYNPYYGHVAAKLASLDRKYRVAMQFNIWDRVKQLGDMKKFQCANLALLSKFLIAEKAQSLGLLKVIEFADLDKTNMKFLKLILSGLLKELDTEKIFDLFKAVAEDAKLKTFRDSLKLFMNHFLIKNTHDSELELLKTKIKFAEKGLKSSSSSSNHL